MPAAIESSQTVMGRVALLLEPFRTADGLTLTELAQRTGFPRSSTHRMLLQLVKVGWIRRSGTTYHLGPKMIELGALAQAHDRIHRAALPTMYDLHEDTGLVVHLAVLEGQSLLYLEKVGGRWAADMHSRAGQRRPARETTAGVALLTRRDGPDPGVCDGFLFASGVVHGGNRIRGIAAAFDAGRGEIAALSLAGPPETIPPGADIRLRHAADAVAATLTS